MGSKLMMNQTNTGGAGPGGGEFLIAIRQAEQLDSVHTLVLGDRSSITTIKRAATLAFQSGDPLGVLARLQQVNAVEMRSLEATVRQELEAARARTSGVAVEESQINVAMMERLKEDTEFRNRLFRKLEQEVPQFTQAFLKERDYIMAEAIRRELVDSVQVVEKVVAVVGLAHVPGMEATLRAMFSNSTLPLVASNS
jgi:pheromone shutdown protein TraB